MTWCENALEAAQDADVLVVLTEWNEFRALDLKALRQRMAGDVLVDLRNIFNANTAHERASATRASDEVVRVDRG